MIISFVRRNLNYITISFGLCCLVSGYFLNNDFWQDEVYTLKHFVFLSWETVILDYHSTNNHIAFNVILKFYSGLLNLKNGTLAFDDPFLIRVIPYIFSILTLLLFYKNAKSIYGRALARIALSILCTTIVFVDFSTQVRGYSLSLLITTIQYFTFLNVINKNSRIALFWLFAITALSLLCLPTNIYIAITYFLICLFIYLFPFTSVKYAGIHLNRKKVVIIMISIIGAIIISSLYYSFLLQLQVPNPHLNYFQLFKLDNLYQLFAIFYHFTDYRYHLFLILLVWIILYIKKSPLNSKSFIILPIVLFVTPFLIFFIHGAIIVQRVFISLLPFFVLIVAFAVYDIFKYFDVERHIKIFFIANIFGLLISFGLLIDTSRTDNIQSFHQHDLRNHYYLINFNARDVTLRAKALIQQSNSQLFVLDDFGQTGILYYLKAYHVPFRWIDAYEQLSSNNIILTNNKIKLESELRSRHLRFTKLFESSYQYNLYMIN